MDAREQQVRTWSMLCHLAALAGFIFPIGNVVGPLLVWQIKKNELPEIDVHGKASVNFQLTVLIVNIILVFILAAIYGTGYGFFWRSPFYIFGGAFGFGIILAVINLLSWVLAIVAGLRANNGELYRYPFLIRFIK